MDEGRADDAAGSGDPDPGATVPLTLTDADGSVTRIAPWASWTREQERAPGGDPLLVTRLSKGQLWFSAGGGVAPWRQEVHVGPARISTPNGRCHVVAEPDGGATVTCLEGRVRVGTPLRSPVVLGPDKAAAVSGDGETLVVLDHAVRTGRSEGDGPERPRTLAAEEPVIDLRDGVDPLEDPEPAPGPDDDDEPPAAAAAGDPAAPVRRPLRDQAVADAAEAARRRRRRGLVVAALVALAALIGVAVAAIALWDGDDAPTRKPAPTTSTTPSSTPRSTTTTPPASTTRPATTTTTRPRTTTTTTAAPGPPGTATTSLQSCRRSPTGVDVGVRVVAQGGRPTRFRVTAQVVRGAQVLGTGASDTAALAPGAAAELTVPVPVSGSLSGATCQVASTTAR